MVGRCIGVCIAAASVALALLPGAAQAAICSATTSAGLTTALADVNCDTINLGPGTYTSGSGFTVAVPAFPATRTAIISGPGAGSAAITRSGAGDVLTVPDRAILGLSGVTLGGASNGAGLSVTGTGVATLNNDVISNNTSTANGAGIAFSGATLNVTSSVITGNTTSAQGGGVVNAGTGTVMTPATATFQWDLFTNNLSTGSGGGGAFDTETVNTVTNFKDVTFFGNRANVDGGAVRSALAGATTNLNNVTMTDNVADDDNSSGGDGGGVSNTAGALTVANSIIADNLARGGGAPDCDSSVLAPLTRLGYELVRSETGCTYGSVIGPPPITDTTTGYKTGLDPMLGALAGNGGPTQTRALLPNSPAINAGNPATPSGTGGACEAIDQRGQPRTTSRVLPCDMGAFEVQSAFCASFSGTINEGQTATVNLGCSGIDPFTYALASQPAHGSLSGFDAFAGTVTYVPNAGFAGTDSFTYKGVYGPISSNVATVTLNVLGPPTPSPNSPGVTVPGFNLKAAIKRCKQRVPKGPKRRKCIKKAKKRARNLA